MNIKLFIPALFAILSAAGIHAEGWNIATVGRDGTAFHSTDSGRTWNASKSGTGEYLFSVVSDHNGNFLAVGGNGTVLRSENGGINYRVIRSAGTTALEGIATDGKQNFVAVGAQGSIVYSEGGKEWNTSLSPIDANFKDVATDGHGSWVAVGASGVIIRSTDNGRNWKTSATIKGAPHIESITAAGKGIFYAVSANGLMTSSKDGGVKWNSVQIENRFYAQGIGINSNGELIVVGWNGKVFHSPDGRSWNSVNSGTTQRLMDVSDAVQGRMVAVGFRGTILLSTDNGMTWQNIKSATSKNLNSSAFNFLPDLSGKLFSDSCKLALEIRNNGTGQISDEIYNRNVLKFLTVMDGSHKLIDIDLKTADPKKRLQKPGGTLQIPLNALLTGKERHFTINIDPEEKIRELSKKNNLQKQSVGCSK